MATFFSYTERALRVGATTLDGGRLRSSVPVELTAVGNPADRRTVPASYELFGPGDVLRLGADTIRRRFPMPGVSDAEWEKRAHVELVGRDLPWRYTPQAAAGGALRPWVVLVVGRTAPDQLVLRPDGRVGVGVATQQAHVLAESARWAHLHQTGPDPETDAFARILSPLQLERSSDYVACLVPAFTPLGADAWDGTGPVVVDCYDRWSFRTSELGDFPDLAGKLHQADLPALEAASGGPFGRAQVGYHWRDGHAPDVTLAAAGALRLPPTADPDPADAAPDLALVAEVSALSDRIVTPDGRGVVTAPRYDAAFVTAATQESFAPAGWVAQLRGDPRARGGAGLGVLNAIAWQDRIAGAAATKAADLAAADDRIRHVALGVEASRSLWRRRVPLTDGTDSTAARVLDVLGPSLGRLPADSGGTVLDAVAGRTPRLARALFSSAARRALRPGPARAARAQEGAGGLSSVLLEANRCRQPDPDPADLPRDGGDRGAGQLEEATKEALSELAPQDGDLVDLVLSRLFSDGRRVTPGDLAGILRLMVPGKDGRVDPVPIVVFLNSEHPDPDEDLRGWQEWLEGATGREPCRPVDLVGLAAGVSGAIDPTVPAPPAAVRVLATLPGITHIGPLEIEPELDLPLWSFLAREEPNWMLPGAGDLTEGDVVGLATNPPFVQALLAGANTQTTGELRWRNIALTSRWSPLRKFWQRAGGLLDINPIKQWPEVQALGGPGLTAPGAGAEAVVALQTPLFRRYPATVVYLYPSKPGWAPPAQDEALVVGRVDHTFTGTIGDDLTFFGFPVPPSVLADHWLVLEEPPAGYRFFHERQAPGVPEVPVISDDTAAGFAFHRLAVPVRVLIGPLL